MEKRNKIIAAYGSAIIIIVAITLFALLYEHPKEIPDLQIISSPEIDAGLAGETSPIAAMDEGAVPDGIDRHNMPICPSELEAVYYIDRKRTASTRDDDVYIGIINSKPQIERISISIDDNREGVIETRSLGASVMKSPTMTAWWDSLDEAASKTFVIQLAPEKCRMAVSQLTVDYPPSESDYTD